MEEREREREGERERGGQAEEKACLFWWFLPRLERSDTIFATNYLHARTKVSLSTRSKE